MARRQPSASPNSPRQVLVYDTTLRDGAQAAGVSLSLEDKLLLTKRLDDFGVDYIEGGYPLSNPKDEAYFKQAAKLKLKRSKLAAFGMTRRKYTKAEDDKGIAALLASKAPVVTIVGKASDRQVKEVLSASMEENLRMIADSVRRCRKRGREVIFDAEHLFDGYKDNDAYAVKCLLAALEAGAACVCLCDTNGGSLPNEVSDITARVRRQLGDEVLIGFHGHNDSGLAVANSLAAVQSGAGHVQGTINGIGERCGNADLTAVIPNLALKMGCKCLQPKSLQKLTELSRYFYELANLNLRDNQPFVGTSAFAHKGGMHVHAVRRSSSSYEHVPPEAVGNTRRILISELSGASNVLAKSPLLASIEDPAGVRKILHQVQDMENEGYQFEAAEASFQLLVLKALGKYRKFFDLDHWRVVILRTGRPAPVTEAIVKLRVDGRQEYTVAEGDGPVNALDGALRAALEKHYPRIKEMSLVDYKVRVINSKAATAAKVRVIIESHDKEEYWGTVGVSENIIEASWQALVDSIEYKLLKTHGK